MSTGDTANKARAVALAERMGPGWTVYRVYGARMYRLCLTSLEFKRRDIGDIVHRTSAAPPQPPVVYNRDQWNEREEDEP